MAENRQKRTSRHCLKSKSSEDFTVVLKSSAVATAGGEGDSLRLGIFGASGTGKSYKAKLLTSKIKRLVIFDPMYEYSGRRFATVGGLMAFARKNYASGFRAVFAPAYASEVVSLDELSRELLSLQKGQKGAKITLLVDELDLSYPSGVRRISPRHAFGFLCMRGRHFGINLVGVSQRPSQVDISFRANLSAVYYFRLAEPADMDTALKNLGREWRVEVQNLKDRQYIYKTGGKVIKK